MKQREDWWKESKFLQVDSLICFVSSNDKIIFFFVCDSILSFRREKNFSSNDKSKSDNIHSLFRQANRASVLLNLTEYKTKDVTWIAAHTASFKTRQSLVEFSIVLLSSFQSILQALQKISQKLSLSFAKIVASDSQTSAVVVKSSAYAIKIRFSFSLDVLVDVSLTLKLEQAFDFTKLNAESTLDEAQQFVVMQALSMRLALIQSSSDTEKSYIDVTIIKTLLHNRKTVDLDLIICVCYTNHALDQLLEHLVKNDVKQVIRLDSRFKFDLLQNLTLYHVKKRVELTKTKKHDKWKHNRNVRRNLNENKNFEKKNARKFTCWFEWKRKKKRKKAKKKRKKSVETIIKWLCKRLFDVVIKMMLSIDLSSTRLSNEANFSLNRRHHLNVMNLHRYINSRIVFFMIIFHFSYFINSCIDVIILRLMLRARNELIKRKKW